MGTQLPPKTAAQPPIFGPCPLWPKRWLDEHATWYEGRPWPRHIVLDETQPPKRPSPPNFRPMYIVAKWPDGSKCHLVRSWTPEQSSTVADNLKFQKCNDQSSQSDSQWPKHQQIHMYAILNAAISNFASFCKCFCHDLCQLVNWVYTKPRDRQTTLLRLQQ